MTEPNRSTGGTGDPTDWDSMDLQQLRDLWEALNAAISQQHQDTQNEISDAYRMHPLYAKYFPDDHELAKRELEET